MTGRVVACIAAAGAAVAFAPPSARAEASACGGIAFANGKVEPRTALAVEGTDARCVSEIGAAIAARPYIRTITVSVRMLEAQRAKMSGVADRIAKGLVDAGAQADAVSTVELAAFPGDAPSITISYTERPAGKPVGQIHGVTGTVTVGRTDSQAAAIGTSLEAWSAVRTGDASFARVLLSDGSVLRLGPHTELRVGPIDLSGSLKPWVELHVPTGAVEVSSKAGSAVQVRTGGGRTRIDAGGGTFAIEHSAGATRISAIDATVSVGGTRIPAGHAARAEDGGATSAPVALPGPVPLPPAVGEALPAGAYLQWDRADGAKRYRVELARDADLTRRLVVLTTDDAELSIPRELKPGRWYWRVTPVADDATAGAPSKVGSFEVAR